jgi:hypothetical protein
MDHLLNSNKNPSLASRHERRKHPRDDCFVEANYMTVGAEGPSEISVTVVITSEPFRPEGFPLERILSDCSNQGFA